MTTRTKKPAYGFCAFRPSPALFARLKSLSQRMSKTQNRRVTMSELIVACLNAKLPELEGK